MSRDGTQRKERECPGQSQQRPHGSSSSIFRTTIGFPRSHAASGPRQTSQLATQQLLRRQPDLLDDLLVTSCVCRRAANCSGGSMTGSIPFLASVDRTTGNASALLKAALSNDTSRGLMPRG